MKRENTATEKHQIEIPAGRLKLPGMLCIPRGALAVVAFAHGSGSGRLSPRNQFVAETLQLGKLATLLFDLLDETESDDRRKVFDIPLLAERLQYAADWLISDNRTRELGLGYFGASTGAAAALVAAASQPQRIGAVVSRGGRPDLAMEHLPLVAAPTLLIVGSLDEDALQLNNQALELMRCEKQLVVIPGATHLFPEPGALVEVSTLARNWFASHLFAPAH